MADKNQLKIADHVDLADDDPFAELTRIMGFDPRQPARPAAQPKEAAVHALAPAEQLVDEDDFSLDLEKELLGEFSLDDEAPTHDFAAEAEAYAVEAPAVQAPAQAADVPEVDLDFAADFEAALATSGHDGAAAEEYDAEFDLGLTDDDVRALDVEAAQPAAPVEATAATDADFDAALADIDMDFGDAFASAPAAGLPAEDAASTMAQDETAEADELHLFDEADFRLDDDAASEPAAPVAAEPEPQPTIDESPFSFDEDELRLGDSHPVDAHGIDETAAAPATEDFAFDDIDLTAEDFSAEPEAIEPETAEFAAVEASAFEPVADEPVADEAVAAEPVDAEPEAAAAPELPSRTEPPLFEFAVPRYEPRKLPTSPMDVAAEEFRQREAAQGPAAPEFNLEDELNALLGNIRSGQAGASAARPPEPAGAPVEQAKVEQPAAPEAYQQSHAAYEPADFRPAEPVSFDAPEHPADIDDNLNWDIDESFAVDAAPEPVEGDQPQTYAEDAYRQDGQYETYAGAGQPEDAYAYAEEAQPEDVYDQTFEAEDDLAALDVDDLSFDPAIEEQPSTRYGAMAAGAGLGAAAAHFGSAFGSRPFETEAPVRLSDLPRAPAGQHFAGQAQAAASGAESLSTHRDPVVRGNPLKEDPLDVITALAAKYSKKEPDTPYGHAMGVARGSAPFVAGSVEDHDIDISAAFDEQPDVETIEVADKAIALADDLDIPDLVEEEELPPVSAYDDLDAEFSSLLSEMNAEPRAAAPSSGGQNGTYASFETRPYASQMAGQMAASPVGSRQAPAYADHAEPAPFALDEGDLPGSRPLDQYSPDDYDFDPDMDQEIARHVADEDAREPKSRGVLIAALIGGVALLGAIGAFAFSFGGGSDGDAPALVRAEDGPVKVKPENPGGTTVPNQDSKVYDSVAGEGTADAPQQQTLVTTAEEPVDVTPPPPAMEEDVVAAPSGKSEDRIEQILQETEGQGDDQIAAVAPRKVRTLVVKPDGTLMPREDEPDAAPSDERTDTIAAAVPDAAPAPAIPESTGALQAATQAAPETAAAEPLAAQEDAAVEPASGDRSAMPDTAPIAPLRPADQPIDVVGEVKPDQVAAAATTAAANGNWAMQIASQPSEAAAQSSYQDLARRYGNVLQGREVNIVKAEIAGKGTFWRVRVPAATRNEAISLCENYKAAGGNCFVSR